MLRRPRTTLAGAALVLGAAVALVVATTATGRSQAAPKNTTEPSILYVHPIQVGTVLNADRGAWSGTAPISYALQWLRCNDNGEGCGKITNATGKNYTVVNADERHTLRLDVTASNADGKATARANATAVVPAKPGAPVEISPPVISGQAVVGQTLSTTTGSWRGNQPISYTFKWQTCTSNMTSCSPNGKSGSTYTVAAGDVGKRVRVKVFAANNAGETAGLSDPTDVVANSGGGGGGGNGSSVPVDSLVAGDKLVVDTVNFNPNPVTSRSQPIQVKIKITDTKGKLVRGAFVFFRSTPILTSTPTDAATDSNGIVIYTITPRSNFPLQSGLNVQFYVKAYRQGDPTLAGVAGTRLVQVATSG
jgi:hypothetical protein